MTDVLPVVFVSADKNLAVEMVRGHGKRRHVRRKLKERGKSIYAKEAQSSGKRLGQGVIVSTRQDKSPFAEGGDVDVIRIGLQAGLFQRLGDAPEGIAGKHARRTLHDYESLRAEMARDGAVERGGVKLAERIVCGIGKIDDRSEERRVGKECRSGWSPYQ